jgi:hypothetical protein
MRREGDPEESRVSNPGDPDMGMGRNVLSLDSCRLRQSSQMREGIEDLIRNSVPRLVPEVIFSRDNAALTEDRDRDLFADETG